MKILVITSSPFPIGMAPTNRLISYSKGIVEEGHEVVVHIFRGTENKNKVINSESVGTFSGISFKYTSGSTIWPKSKVGKFLSHTKGLVGSLFDTKGTNIILSTSVSFRINLLYFFLAKVKKIKFIRIEDEYPVMLINKKKNYSKAYSYLYLNYYYKLFDGMIVITKNLEEYYRNKLRKGVSITVIPMTVELERFDIVENKFSKKYIAFCGYMGGGKNDVTDLIKAFKFFHDKFQDYYLYLIGYTKDIGEMNELKKTVESLKLTDYVVFTGKVSRDEMPDYLVNARMLALARPSGTQAHGGFPTKLGEYLATGKPVICTKVGEIPVYLKHKVNSFLSEPDNPKDFAEQLIFVANNYEFALSVGEKGKELAYGVFNYRIQSRNIIEFLQRIK